mmetsp:Transcript_18496/g.13296  ORF Transcript_18496/g.13296 Transcript_18496/m.13296 type:complete len:332 (+) Transcript_18496:516-1511(+)
MSGFSFHNTIFSHADTGHQTKRTESLGDDITLNITIVVLTGPNETTVTLECLSNHIIDQTMFIINALGLELILEFLLINVLENIFEKTIILLEDGVLGGELERQLTVQRVLHAGASEGGNGSVSVEHTQVGTGLLEVVNLLLDGCTAIIRGENELDLAWLLDYVILATILITVSVSTNDNRLGPSWHQSGNVLNDNRFSEDSSVKDVSNSTVRRSPHLLKLELFNTTLIRSNSGTFDTNLMLLDGVSGIDGDLIVGLITRGDTQVIVLGLKIKIRIDMSLLDPVPDDTGHLITIDINDGLCNLNLGKVRETTFSSEFGKHSNLEKTRHVSP